MIELRGDGKRSHRAAVRGGDALGAEGDALVVAQPLPDRAARHGHRVDPLPSTVRCTHPAADQRACVTSPGFRVQARCQRRKGCARRGMRTVSGPGARAGCHGLSALTTKRRTEARRHEIRRHFAVAGDVPAPCERTNERRSSGGGPGWPQGKASTGTGKASSGSPPREATLADLWARVTGRAEVSPRPVKDSYRLRLPSNPLSPTRGQSKYRGTLRRLRERLVSCIGRTSGG